MLSPKNVVVAGLVIMAAGFAFANVWFSAARSTIPIAIDGIASFKEMRLEKHPGVDDVYLLTIDGERVLQVDRAVHEAIRLGADLKKQPWQTSMDVNGRGVDLDWSTDARRMPWAMALAFVVCVTTGVVSWRSL